MPVIRCLKRKSAALENEYGAQRFQNEARSRSTPNLPPVISRSSVSRVPQISLKEEGGHLRAPADD